MIFFNGLIFSTAVQQEDDNTLNPAAPHEEFEPPDNVLASNTESLN